MSDTVITEVESSSVFADNLGIPKRLSTKGARYTSAELGDKRIIAVACALELVRTAVASGSQLNEQLDLLGHYTDQIQAALNNV